MVVLQFFRLVHLLSGECALTVTSPTETVTVALTSFGKHASFFFFFFEIRGSNL